MIRESKFALSGTVLFLASLLLPPIFDSYGDSYIAGVSCIIAVLISMGLFVFAALIRPRWWFAVFFCLIFALGWFAVFVLHQH